MSTPTVSRQFGRNEYRAAARRVRRQRRDWADFPEVADTMAAAFVAMFTADATRAGQPDHFDAEVFTSRTQVLEGEALAEVKAAKAAKVQAEVAALEAMLAVESDTEEGTEDE